MEAADDGLLLQEQWCERPRHRASESGTAEWWPCGATQHFAWPPFLAETLVVTDMMHADGAFNASYVFCIIHLHTRPHCLKTHTPATPPVHHVKIPAINITSGLNFSPHCAQTFIRYKLFYAGCFCVTVDIMDFVSLSVFSLSKEDVDKGRRVIRTITFFLVHRFTRRFWASATSPSYSCETNARRFLCHVLSWPIESTDLMLLGSMKHIT